MYSVHALQGEGSISSIVPLALFTLLLAMGGGALFDLKLTRAEIPDMYHHARLFARVLGIANRSTRLQEKDFIDDAPSLAWFLLF